MSPFDAVTEQVCRELDDFVHQIQADWKVPGLAVALVKDGELIFTQGYGLREAGKDGQVDHRTLFGVGSLTKAFTATLLATLVDDRLLGWDDRVVDHLPWFQMSDPYITYNLTVRDLLLGRSGLVGGDALGFGTDLSRREIVRQLRFLPIKGRFRETLGAQTLTYVAAGEIATAVTGKTWDDLLRERVLRPLKMKASVTSSAELEDIENSARPHALFDGEPEAIRRFNVDHIGPAAGIYTNLVDMAQWLRMHLSAGKLDGRVLVQPESIRSMHAPQAVDADHWINPAAQFMTTGLGWYVDDYQGHKVLEHGGAINGMGALAAMLPDERLGLVVLSNLDFSPGMLLAIKFWIFDRFLGIEPRDWNGEFLLEQESQREAYKQYLKQRTTNRAHGTKPSLRLEKYAGVYAGKSGLAIQVRVALEWNKLVLYFGPQIAGDLEHWHYDSFLVKYRDTPGEELVTFKLNSDGLPGALSLPGMPDYYKVSNG